MTKLDPIAIAIDMLKSELPAFETRFSAGHDSIAIHGALPIGAGASAEIFLYALRRPTGYMAEYEFKPATPITETPEARALRLAEERKKIEEDVSDGVKAIVERIREFAIEAVNLRPTIDREIEEAREQGRTEGYARGYTTGKSDGRREMSAEIVDEIRAAINVL